MDQPDVSQLPADAVNAPASGVLSLLNLGFVAGILEGEGYFSTLGRNAGSRVGVKMTDLDVLERLQAITKIGTINGPYIPAADNHGKKPYWTWSVSKQTDAAALMMTVFPLMSERRKCRIEERLALWRSKQLTGLCRPGLHPKSGPGRCPECRRATQARTSRRSYERRKFRQQETVNV